MVRKTPRSGTEGDHRRGGGAETSRNDQDDAHRGEERPDQQAEGEASTGDG